VDLPLGIGASDVMRLTGRRGRGAKVGGGRRAVAREMVGAGRWRERIRRRRRRRRPLLAEGMG
jgi:hypothetical protein